MDIPSSFFVFFLLVRGKRPSAVPEIGKATTWKDNIFREIILEMGMMAQNVLDKKAQKYHEMPGLPGPSQWEVNDSSNNRTVADTGSARRTPTHSAHEIHHVTTLRLLCCLHTPRLRPLAQCRWSGSSCL